MNNNNIAPPEWDLLLSAAQKNNAARIRTLVETEGVPVNHANGVGQTALHVASLWGREEAVQTLLELGANPTLQNRLTGATPLHMVVQQRRASLEQQQAVAALLLQHGADASTADQFGNMALDYALQQPNVDTEHPLVAQLRPTQPQLFAWIAQGDLEQVRQALADTLDDTARSRLCNESFGTQTPLQVAVDQILEQCSADDDDNDAHEKEEKDDKDNDKKDKEVNLATRLEILEQLVGGGALLRSESSSEKEKLSDSEDPPLFRVLEGLREAYRQSDPQGEADKERIHVLEQTAVLLQTVHDKEAPENNTSDQEAMARLLHTAARRNEVQMLQFLCGTLHCDVNSVNRQGMTALQFAARSGQAEAVKVLVEQLKADTEHKDHMGRTARDAAVTNNKTNVLEFLE